MYDYNRQVVYFGYSLFILLVCFTFTIQLGFDRVVWVVLKLILNLIN
jgi:hypothetical protein